METTIIQFEKICYVQGYKLLMSSFWCINIIVNKVLWSLWTSANNRPIYSCILNNLAFEWKRG